MPHKTTSRVNQRRGISLVELLVAIGIVGLLAALILPAVQSAREIARRTQCTSQLKQLITAIAQYSETHNVYPPSGGLDQPSLFVRTLPYFEQSQLYHKFDFSRSMSSQPELAFRRPAILVCPSDGTAFGDRAMRSYGGNMGWYVPLLPNVPSGPSKTNGVIAFLVDPQIGPGHIEDGLTNTGIISEMLPSGYSTSRQTRWNEVASAPLFGRSADVMGNDCTSATESYLSPRGASWTFGGAAETLYHHVLPPNDRTCNWVYPATSIHLSGGVNLGMCDGAVRFVSQTVDVRVWRAMGTRNGSETTNLP